MVLHIIRRHHRAKPIQNADRFQQRLDIFGTASGGYRHRQTPLRIARNGGDRLDKLGLGNQRNISLLFLAGHSHRIHIQPLLVLEHVKNLHGRHPAQRVESFLRKDNVVPFANAVPRPPVQGHGIDERAVAIENKAANL